MGNKESKKFSPDELRGLQQELRINDANFKDYYQRFFHEHPDGKVKKSEFPQLYNDFFATGDVDASAKELFQVFDTDNNGHIDFREFLFGVTLLAKGNPEKKMRVIFQAYDKDYDGYFSKAEFSSAMGALYRTISSLEALNMDQKEVDARVENLFNRLNPKHKDKVSFEELVTAVRRDAIIQPWVGVTDDKPDELRFSYYSPYCG